MSDGNFYTSERGGMKMNFEGHSYNMDRTYDSHTTWRCIRSRWKATERCLGRARSNGANIFVIQAHNHASDPQTAEALRLKSILYGEAKVPNGKIQRVPRPRQSDNSEGEDVEKEADETRNFKKEVENEENWTPSHSSSTNELLKSIAFSASTSDLPKRRALTSLRPNPKPKRIKLEDELEESSHI